MANSTGQMFGILAFFGIIAFAFYVPLRAVYNDFRDRRARR